MAVCIATVRSNYTNGPFHIARQVFYLLSNQASSTFESKSKNVISRRRKDTADAFVDSGATDHMFPDRAAFLLYHHSTSAYDVVMLSENNPAPIAG